MCIPTAVKVAVEVNFFKHPAGKKTNHSIVSANSILWTLKALTVVIPRIIQHTSSALTSFF